MIFQHHRHQIWNKVQHPYSHSLDEFTYVNPALPDTVVNAQQAMDWMFAVFYPNTKDSVATPAALPLAGNTLNDYRVVNDDGDGKAAAYRWMQLEGDVSPEWKKIYDMDWGEDSILSNFLLKTQDVYVYRYGIDDLDETGAPFAGDLAGQRIYGGQSSGTHLTLFANSGDGVGAQTGFVQFGDDVRPLFDSTVTLGTNTYRFLNFYTDVANIGTMTITDGSITDTTGAIDFGDEAISTSSTATIGDLLLQDGSITSTSGLIDFDNEDLTTTGLVTADGGVDVGTTHIRSGGLIFTEAASGDDFTFTPDGGLSLFMGDLEATGDLAAGNANFSNIVTIESPDTFNRIVITQFNTGNIDFSSTGRQNFISGATTALSLTATTIDLNEQTSFHDTPTSWFTGATEYLRITDARIDSLTEDLTIDGSDTLTLEADTVILSTIDFAPDTDNALDLGQTGAAWNDLYLKGTITDDTNAIAMATLLSFRDALVGAAAGHSLFYNGSLWLSSVPDSEIDHGIISGLGDDDHTQYGLLAGRSGGQTFNGGVDASDNLVLDSTAHATKGNVVFASILRPSADGTLDIGTASFRVDDLYMAGEGIGFRIENAANFGALPAASGSNVGRVAWLTDTDTMYVDIGGTWKQLTSDKYTNDDAVTWDGTNVTQTYTTSGDIDDARNAIWEFQDNTNGFRSVQGAVITKTQTQVTVTFTVPPASGTYRLVGVS